MRFSAKRNHMIDLLFPVALLFVFAGCSLTVLLLAANIYRSVTENASLHYTAQTSLSYISEKIHQSDADGGISLESFDGRPALLLRQSYEDGDYCTYIYTYDGSLMELFAKEGAQATASSGKAIMPVEDFSMEQIGDGLFSFSCTDADGQTASTVVEARSVGLGE